ncbi:serine/threonine-protein kinase D6PKL1 [Lotus japonicus]|uniref:serine/threonine-protein kinase D6PKL1 n=1 Tax=Lotus japonicus TaxID=34305 RepID=UPI00258F0846|nr:serine/threonine-protein kinase D6PKL1 [Lotus japonicus]
MDRERDPWLDDLADDLQSLSFASTTTTAATADIKRSTSFSSETTTLTGSSSAHLAPPTSAKPHAPSSDPRWAAIHQIRSESPSRRIVPSDLRFSRRLGSGDISSVYLAELNEGALPVMFAAKVMDKKELASRSKEGRAKTEREILQMLDHPFLPTLYATIDAAKWLCLLTEFCPGGDLHLLRQRQPNKRFPEPAVRFYASEVLVALEYLHMLGIVYRDLKPENVLVRSDGHIMLTDFDLSLKCDDSTSTAQIISTQNSPHIAPHKDPRAEAPQFNSSCIIPNCIVPAVSCFQPKRKRKKKQSQHTGPEFVAEPMDIRSMSFVGTHEYLAPEIVSGEGHGSAVDWWTLGIFIFELFYGVTPFRGMDNELTLANIVARALEFPKEPTVPATAKDLISQLLVKDPERRLGSTMGASAIKHHPFFQGVNWALLRCTAPPYVPPPYTTKEAVSDDSCPQTPVDYY